MHANTHTCMYTLHFYICIHVLAFVRVYTQGPTRQCVRVYVFVCVCMCVCRVSTSSFLSMCVTQQTAIDRNRPQHTATDCNRLQQTNRASRSCFCFYSASYATLQQTTADRNRPQHTATHQIKPHDLQFARSTLRHATHCNRPQHTATDRNTLQQTATHCNRPQHTATHCSTPNRAPLSSVRALHSV